MKRVVVVLLLFAASRGRANTGGVSGFSGKNGGPTCAQCHSGGTVPSVMVVGPATLEAGQTATYRIGAEFV